MVPSARLAWLHPPPGRLCRPYSSCVPVWPGEWLCSCAQENSLERVFSPPLHPPTPECRVSGGASQSPAKGSRPKGPRLLTFRPIFLPDVQTPLSLELFCVSHGGLLHFPAGVKRYPPSTPACWDPSAPPPLTHTQIPPASISSVSHSFPC